MNQEITIGGRKFRFRKPTLGFLLEIESKKFQEFLSTVSQEQGFLPVWKKFVLTAFESQWWWKFVLPKELRTSNLLVSEFSEVQKSFFTYVEEVGKQLSGKETS